MWGVTYGKKKGWQQWKPGCGWGAQDETGAAQAAPHSALWSAVADGHVTQRAYPDESITLRCENGPWKGGSFRLYPGETELELGPITYVACPPTEGGPGRKGSVNPTLTWHLMVKGSLDDNQLS